MGLLAGLLTLPLAPLRAVVWLGQHIEEQVRAESDPVAAIRRQLMEVEELLDQAVITEDECADRQDALLADLLSLSISSSNAVATGQQPDE